MISPPTAIGSPSAAKTGSLKVSTRSCTAATGLLVEPTTGESKVGGVTSGGLVENMVVLPANALPATSVTSAEMVNIKVSNGVNAFSGTKVTVKFMVSYKTMPGTAVSSLSWVSVKFAIFTVASSKASSKVTTMFVVGAMSISPSAGDMVAVGAVKSGPAGTPPTVVKANIVVSSSRAPSSSTIVPP